MVDGLKLTMTGEELRARVEQRLAEHRARAARWKNEISRTADDATEEAPLLPRHICGNEAARSEWRAERLTFVLDHLDPAETYRLGEMDLEFAELLPEEPELHGPEDYEDGGLFARDLVTGSS